MTFFPVACAYRPCTYALDDRNSSGARLWAGQTKKFENIAHETQGNIPAFHDDERTVTLQRIRIELLVIWEWQGQQGSNPRPTVLETVALPTELYP
jgi:hypothetical protein